MTAEQLVFNPPPGWPRPPAGWVPPKGWTPDPAWPDPPEGWQLWLAEGSDNDEASVSPPASDSASAQSADGAASASPDSDRRILLLEAEIAALRAQLEAATSATDVVVLDDERVLQEVGIYRYHHPLEDAAAYKDRLDDLGGRIADLVKTSRAIEMSNMFTFDNSLAKGRKMANDLAKLMLRAYNAEADNSLRSLRAGNVLTAKRRLEASRDAIRKLGAMMQMHISDAFHALRLEEIELTADYLMKKQEEREAAIEERARLREERRVAAELAAERARLDKERSHLLNALEALKASGSTDAELEQRLTELDDAIAQNDYRAANIRAGYVYVISNRGAFGENVVKIGLTRRLEPRCAAIGLRSSHEGIKSGVEIRHQRLVGKAECTDCITIRHAGTERFDSTTRRQCTFHHATPPRLEMRTIGAEGLTLAASRTSSQMRLRRAW